MYHYMASVVDHAYGGLFQRNIQSDIVGHGGSPSGSTPRRAILSLIEESRRFRWIGLTQLDDLAARVEAVEAEIIAWHKGNEASQRLAMAPGIGPITASALVASVGDARQVRSSRHFAAWLGLTPRMASSGDRQCIGRISKGGDRYLRTLLIHGARAVIGGTAPSSNGVDLDVIIEPGTAHPPFGEDVAFGRQRAQRRSIDLPNS